MVGLIAMINSLQFIAQHDVLPDVTSATSLSLTGVDGALSGHYNDGCSGAPRPARTHVMLLDVRPIGIFGFFALWGAPVPTGQAAVEPLAESMSAISALEEVAV